MRIARRAPIRLGLLAAVAAAVAVFAVAARAAELPQPNGNRHLAVPRTAAMAISANERRRSHEGAGDLLIIVLALNYVAMMIRLIKAASD